MRHVFVALSLWDQRGVEASFAGYYRQPTRLVVDGQEAALGDTVCWALGSDLSADIVEVRIHLQGAGAIPCRLAHPIRAASIRAGDNISLPARGITLRLEGDPLITKTISGHLTCGFEEFIEANPMATANEIWEAAFVAGHQTAYTLLTGEPQ